MWKCLVFFSHSLETVCFKEVCHVLGWHVEKKLFCSSLWEVLQVNKESSESLLIGLTRAVNIWSKDGSLWKTMVTWSVETSSCGNSEEGTQPVPCCTARAVPVSHREPFWSQDSVKGMTTAVAFSCCFVGISNESARESYTLELPAPSY